MIPVDVVGVGLSPNDLTKGHVAIVHDADVLVGGRRLLDFFPESRAEKKPVEKNLGEIVRFIREKMENRKVVVLASGDPLFHGIGSYLVRKLGPENVRIYPNISSMAAAFARLKTSWDNAALVSVHGGEKAWGPDLEQALKSSDKIAVLTDPIHNPAWVARRVLACQNSAFKLRVLSCLGTRDEKIARLDPEKAAGMKFDEPNLVVLIKSPSEKPEKENELFFHPGMEDRLFLHEKGLITKAEVRALTLSRLRLTAPDLCMWDLGAGCGSVGIEAALILIDGMVAAVEKHAGRVEMIQKNAQRFGAKNLEIHLAQLPRAMDTLPDPDRVFIGGGGKDLASIIREAVSRLRPGGVIVVNTVLVQSMACAVETLESVGLAVDAAQVQVNRGKSMPMGLRFEAQNPVWVITGSK